MYVTSNVSRQGQYSYPCPVADRQGVGFLKQVEVKCPGGDSHMKRMGCFSEILKRMPKMYQDHVLWVWLEIVFSPERGHYLSLLKGTTSPPPLPLIWEVPWEGGGLKGLTTRLRKNIKIEMELSCQFSKDNIVLMFYIFWTW